MQKLILGAMILGAVLAFSSCNNSHSHEEHNHEVHNHEEEATGAHAHGEIVLSPEMAAEAGVEVQTINPAPFRGAIRCSGRISAAGTSETTVAAKTSGILRWQGGTPYPGARISAGQTLAGISANGMSDGDAASRNAVAYETAKKEYERAKSLRESRIISEREFNAAEAEYLNALNAYSETTADGGMAVKAPMGGYFSRILKAEGEYVQAGEPIAVVTSNSRLTLSADIPASQAGKAGSIDGVNFRTDYSDGLLTLRGREGRPASTAASLSSAYLPVSFEFRNPGSLMPGSYAQVWLLTAERQGVLAVPESALTEEQGEYYIYTRLDEECYRRIHVTTGERNGEYVEITSGLHGGEEVVTAGVFGVRVAASAKVIPGHTHNH